MVALAAFLAGCGNEPSAQLGAPPPQPAGEVMPQEHYIAAGYRDIVLYRPAGEGLAFETPPGVLPITLSDGEGYSVQVPGSWAGTRMFIEIDGAAREVWLDVQPGDTLFLPPR